jgi:type I restriction enzyme S subunit
MSALWPTVTLGDVLRRSEHIIPLDPEVTYKEVTVRINGKGVVERRQVQGVGIAADRRYRATSGQFIISRIDARHGASGLIPNDLDGAVVTNDFPLFDVAKDRLDPAFLGWMSKTASFVELCKRASEGTTNRVRLSEDRFKAMNIVLPPLDEQRRIVARIEELAAKAEEARVLRSIAAQRALAILPSAIDVMGDGNWPLVELQDVCDPQRPITYGIVQAGDHFPEGVPYIRVSDMAKPELTPIGMLRTAPWVAERYTRSEVRTGDIVFAIRATIGKMRFVPAELNGANLTQGTARIAASADAEPRYLYWALQGSTATEAIEKASKGSTFKEITLGRLRTIPVRLPPLQAQRRIVSKLDALQAKVDAVKALQTETAAGLDAMLPAILDKAFKGEL